MTQARNWLILIGGLFCVGLLYWSGLQGPFLLDDLQTIDMARVSSWQWSEVWTIAFANDTGPLGRPLSVLSFIVNDFWLGPDSFGYKLVNLCLHLLTAVMGYCFFKALFRATLKDKPSYATALLIAVLLWAAHPLLISTTLYSVQRMAILSALFTLGALWSYVQVRFYAKPWLWLLVATGYIAAIASKENAVLFPFFILIIELTAPKDSYSSRWLKFAFCFSAITIVAGITFYLQQWPRYAQTFAANDISLLSYVGLQAQALCFYLKQIFLPSLGQMSIYHDDFQSWFWVPKLVCGLSIVALILCALVGRQRWPLLSFGVLWFFASHALESTILPLEPVFEHRNYLASLGLLVGAVISVSKWLQTSGYRRYQPLVTLLAVIIVCSLSLMRVQTWATAERFLLTAVANHPQSARAHIELANYWFATGQFEKGLDALNLADTIAEQSGPATHILVAHCQLEDTNQYFDKAVQSLKSKTVTPYTLLVLNSLVANQFNGTCPNISLSMSEQMLSTAIANPTISQKPDYQATLYHLKAGTLVKQQKLNEAIEALAYAARLNPKKIEPLFEKAQLQIMTEQASEAQKTIEQIQQHAQIKVKAHQATLKALQEQLEAN